MADLLTLSTAHEANIYSQAGEDGVIKTICDALGIAIGTAVEFGAWDGTYLSNTASLRERGWEICLIEGDTEKYATLAKSFAGNAKVVPVNTWVAATGDNSLDKILAKHFPKPIDVLSIDIDGDDYHVFAELMFRPRIIVIEFNPTIPPFIDRVNPLGRNKGSSIAAIARLGASKGYDLVHATRWNAFFVDASRNGRIRPKTTFEAFRWNLIRFVISDFDGENWFADSAERQARIVNPWDKLPAAFQITYPPELLGFDDSKASARANFVMKSFQQK